MLLMVELIVHLTDCLGSVLAWFDGKRPLSWNSCITNWRRWSSVLRSDDVFSAPATPELATVTEAEFMEVAEAPDEPCLLGVVGEGMPSENES